MFFFYLTGIPFDSKIGDLILDATAKDPDVPSDEEDIHGGNRITYSIRSSELFRAGSTLSSGSLVPSPFKMEKNGRLVLSSLIGTYCYFLHRKFGPNHLKNKI